MHSGAPTGARIVGYFFLVVAATGVLSLCSPVTFGTVQEIPQSPAWGVPVLVCEVPSVVRIPSCAVDYHGTVHIVYCDKAGEQTDIFYTTIQDGSISDPRNLTAYNSLKGSVTCALASETLYVAFLDNRMGRWQVFLLNVNDNHLIQITDTETHKEDVFLSTGPSNEVVITWTDVQEGIPRVLLTVVSQGAIVVDKKRISDYPSTRASTAVDSAIHVIYLEKQVYQHVTYAKLDSTGEEQQKYDLGECTHADPLLLGIFKGPQLIVADTITCVWSDSRTGSHNLYACEVTPSGEIIQEQLTDYPLGVWSWMPSIVDQNGITHIVYVNNAFGHRLFHAALDNTYEELGTVTSRRERATAPFVVCDTKGFLHCVYLQFREDSNLNLVYRNTYTPVRPEEEDFSERIEGSSIRYVYSFGLSFLFSFPFMVGDNMYGIIILVIVFFGVRSSKIKQVAARKGSEYIILIVFIVILSVLRGPVESAHLAPVAYNSTFAVYGLGVTCAATVVFKYLMQNRFDFETRFLVCCFVFLYLYTFFLLLPVIPHI
jgi:hypothetical protein